MKILVTGATGYIGGTVARHLKKEGYDVRCLVRRTGILDGFEETVGDLLAPETLIRACSGTDVVLHFAGLLGSWSTPREMLEPVNIDGPRHLVRAAKKAGVRYVLHVSAGGVAGPLGDTLGDESTPVTPRRRMK